MEFYIDPDIRKAHTLPGSFYRTPSVFEALKERVLLPSWQFIGHKDCVTDNVNCYPFTFLPGSINEPLLLTKSRTGELRCISNVCTHRGKILVEKASKQRFLSCKYHGRCFHLDGLFRSMPEFGETENFPSETDNLVQLPLKNLGNLLFTNIQAERDFETIFAPIIQRMHWFPFEQLQFDQANSDSYEIESHWALYCDNYLEGFHVPFVHPGLNESLDYQNYDTEIFSYCNLQLGIADTQATCFDLPKEAEDYGKRVYAYYWWVFPNLMINIYTWGVSINVVLPKGPNKTQVLFKTYRLPDQQGTAFSKEDLHQTELEDEEVVESVHQGLKSRLYKHGRFSPNREQGVHHFHSLLAKFVNCD